MNTAIALRALLYVDKKGKKFMFGEIFKMMLGISPEKAEKEIKEKQRKDVIHPFPDAPIKIDFVSSKLMGRYCPEYIATPDGRIFTAEEEDILVKAMFDACVRYYCYPIIKSTIDSFEAFIVRECRRRSVKDTTVKKYDTLQEQLDKLNMRVEDTFARNHPNHMYRYNPDRDYLDMYRVNERNQAYKESAKELNAEKELRKKEYEKYRNIWY